MENNIPTFYTMVDIAKFCGVTYEAIQVRQARGKLPKPAAQTVGGRGLWTEEQVREFNEERLRKAKTGHNPFKALSYNG